MKQLLIFLCFTLSYISGISQTVNWKGTNHWKLYALNKSDALLYPVDTLSQFGHITLDDNSMIGFLSNAKLLPKSIYAAWMGFYIGSYETIDHQLRKIIFSNYGGFFYDSFSKRYYEIPQELHNKWDEFITKDLDELFTLIKNK
jgi:hypothetical protein